MKTNSWKVHALVIIFLPILLIQQVSLWHHWLPLGMSGARADFGNLYAAGYMVRTGAGKQLYDYASEEQIQHALVPSHAASSFVHLPYEAALFVPFSFLGFRDAYLAFMALNFVLLALSLGLLGAQIDDPRRRWALPILGLGFLPFSFGMLNGQDSMIMLFLMTISTWMLRRNHDAGAGAMIGLCLFRFELALPIALLFFLWRRWRFVRGFAAATALVLTISLVMVGPGQASEYGRNLLALSMGHSAGYLDFPVSMVSIRGLVLSLSSGVPKRWQQAMIIAGSALLLWWRGRHAPGNGAEAMEWAIPVALLVGYHVYLYDASILAISLIAVLRAKRIQIAAAISFISPAVGVIWPQGMFLGAIALLLFAVSQRPTVESAIRSATTGRWRAWA